jgi:hypothetical protein
MGSRAPAAVRPTPAVPAVSLIVGIVAFEIERQLAGTPNSSAK